MQLRNLGNKAPIFGCTALDNAQEVNNSNGALDRSWFIEVNIKLDFAQRYRNRFRNSDNLQGAATHYDLIYFLAALPAVNHSAEKILSTAFSQKSIGKSLNKAEFVRKGGDQFLDIEMVPKEVFASQK